MEKLAIQELSARYSDAIDDLNIVHGYSHKCMWLDCARFQGKKSIEKKRSSVRDGH